MTIKRIALALVGIVGLLTPVSGCALFTAQRVGTYAAKETGKAAYRGYREHQREKEYSDRSSDGNDYRVVNDRD
jgi:hypothetical protein